MLIIGLIIGLVVGFLFGFVTGARAKQLATATKMMAASLKTILKKLAPAEADDEGQAEAATHENPIDDIDLTDVDGFLDTDGIPGLDDHLETIFNPIVMYKIKVAKEEARKEKMRAQLIQDGYDPDLMDDDDANAVAPAIRQNALSTLISVGARVTPMGSSQSAEAAAREDKKRQLRNIDTYLAKNMEAETTRVPLAQRKAKQEGARYVSALEMARKTAVKRAGGDVQERINQIPTMAKSARNQLRFLKTSRPDIFAKMMPSKSRGGGGDDDEEEEKGLQRKRAGGDDAAGGGGPVSATDLAAIQAEFEEGALEDDGEEGGEEGGDLPPDDESELEA